MRREGAVAEIATIIKELFPHTCSSHGIKIICSHLITAPACHASLARRMDGWMGGWLVDCETDKQRGCANQDAIVPGSCLGSVVKIPFVSKGKPRLVSAGEEGIGFDIRAVRSRSFFLFSFISFSVCSIFLLLFLFHPCFLHLPPSFLLHSFIVPISHFRQFS